MGPSNLELTGKDNQDDLYNFAYETLTGFEEPLRISRAKAIAEKENFLYARSLLEDEHLVAALANAKGELGLPVGLSDLYRTSLLKHGLDPDSPSWEERFQPVFGALVSSFGEGLTAAQLAVITNLRRSRVDGALKVCRRFCLETQPDGPFQIYHASFREFLKSDRKYRVYADEANVNIATAFYKQYRTKWLVCEDRYALKYLPLHFLYAVRANASDDECRSRLLQLMTDLSYLGQASKAGNLDGLLEALRATQKLLSPSPAEEMLPLACLVQVLDSEKFSLKFWSRVFAEKQLTGSDSYFWQQVRNRAFGLRFDQLVSAAEKILQQAGAPYLLERWPATAPIASGLGMLLAAFPSKQSISALAVAGDGRCVAVGLKGGAIRLHDFASGKTLGLLSGHTTEVLALSFNAAHLYSVCKSGWIITWEIETLQEIRRRRAPKVSELSAAVIAGDARRLMVHSRQGDIILIGLDNRTRSRSLGRHADIRGRLAITKDARYAVSTDGKANAAIWKLRTGKRRDLKLPELPAPGGILDAFSGFVAGRIDSVFSRNETQVLLAHIAGTRCAILAYDLQSQKLVFKKSYADRVIAAPVELSDGVLAYARNWFGLDIWKKEDEKPTAATYLGSWIDHLAATPDGKCIIVGDRQGSVRVFQFVASQTR